MEQLPPAVCFTRGNVYMATLLSRFVPHFPSLLVSMCSFSTSTSLLHNGILFSHKRNEVGSFVVIWMELESAIRREVREIQISFLNAYTHTHI